MYYCIFAVLQTDMDDIEMDPHELFMQLGMLVVESRLPDLSTKGRRQGPHCPLVMGEPNWHTCDLHTYYVSGYCSIIYDQRYHIPL